MFKNYNVGSFKVEIVFWIFTIHTLSKYAAASTVLTMFGVENIPFWMDINEQFTFLLSFFAAARLMYASTKYFDISPKKEV